MTTAVAEKKKPARIAEPTPELPSMLVITATLSSVTPYSQSGPIRSKRSGGSMDEFDERTWREHIHADADGMVFIPPMAIKNCLTDIAAFLSEKVPGRGQATYTKNFMAGIMVTTPITLGIHVDDVACERLFLNADGKKNGKTKVWKHYPIIPAWKGDVEIMVIDPILISNVAKVEEYLRKAGKFIGIGRFRPRNGGFYGKFNVDKFKIES